MTQGIFSLMRNGQAPQNPGQAAPAQVMPPQQGGIAAPITGTLEKLPPQQLLSMYNNPQDMTPKWAVATAYAKAVEQARLMQMAQGQSAMAQNQAQSQQPPVAQQVMMQPMPQETQFARHGGIMHGYAGGGAVAFDIGGRTTGYAPDYQAMRDVGIDLSPYDSPEVRADKFRRFEEYKRSGKVPPPAAISTELPSGAAEDREKLSRLAAGVQKNVLLPAGAAIADVATAIPRGLMGAYNSTVIRGMRAAGIPAAYLPDFAGDDFSSPTPFYDRLVRLPEQQEREEAKRKAEEPPPQASYTNEGRGRTRQGATGSTSDSGPARAPTSGTARPLAGPVGIAAGLKTQGFPSPVESPALRKALDDQNKLARDQAKITEDERAARGGIDALSKQIIEEKRAEEARRLAQAESRYGEAKSRSERDPLSDMAYLGRMIGEARGAKRTGDLLAGWASGAGKAQGEREDALRKAEEKYDLSRNEISNLANLRQQAQLDQARLIETRASGDANRIRAAEAQAAASGVKLAEYEQTLGIKGREFDLEQMKIETQRAATAAASAQANQQRLMGIISSTEARKQELIRKITDDYKDSKKMIYAMASVPNADRGALEAKAAADRELAAIIGQRTAELDKILAQTAAQIPGFGGVYQNTALPPGVTVKKTGA